MSNSTEKVNNSTNNSTNEIKNRVKGITACRVPEDDYISRQEAIDVCMKYNGQGYVWSCIMGDLRKLPSAQPEIIRCKDCKHWTRTYGDDRWSLGDCDVFDKHLVMSEGYCAWAERRTDG